ncbi:SDR family NAD(P)-dependent oxidoreductase, partial [Streptomyces sp. NPDC088116]|uniref:type I polyketide synthase n=1 Tax=Streptomyces sp. NPDC088116 TaxID=3365825 RepID=UPI00382E17CB
QGLPGVSLAWGMWENSAGMGGTLNETDLNRMRQQGFPALTTEHGLMLLDTALRVNEPLAVPVALRTSALASARGGLPAVLHTLVPTASRRRTAGHAPAAVGGELAGRLQGLPAAERERLLLELVQTHVAGVLGHASGAAVDAARAFKDLGFDSLTAVDLRNRLTAATALQLPATLIFDHPNPAALADYLRTRLLGVAAEQVKAAPLVRTTAVAPDGDPIVIVGMGCRYPGGATSPEALWDLVDSARDGFVPLPTDRGWNDRALADVTGAGGGGFVSDVARFDAELFGISPREALAMDPQQRLLLETSWEALERAAIDPSSLRGSSTGVFTGVSANGYGGDMHEPEGGTEGYLLTGSTPSVASGRLAYTLGLEGPAVSVDTACSSALVALHLAAQALRSGECDLALAGGATVMATPGIFLEFARQGGLAADGRCKSFAEDADGTGWAEGAGVLVLERLSDARRLGHNVLAVVRGSAVNQDGASNGLTAPNGPSQQRVIRQALANAHLTTADVDAVEAHGTGTKLGDPIEAQALLATYGQDRDGAGPLWLGSVKSNIGHSQAAAGAAGLIKMVMALGEQRLPKTLYADERSSHVDWESGAVELLTEAREWPRGERPRLAGVSSFGISGTNAHVIIEEAPEPAPAVAEDRPTTELPTVPWVLSGRTEEALRAQAGRLAAVLDWQDADPVDIGLSLSATRAVLDHRAVVLGPDQEALRAGLNALADADPTVVSGVATEGRTGWMFTGQGSQRLGMGRELYERFPLFAETLDHACSHLDAALAGRPGFGIPVREVLFAAEGSDAAALLDLTGYAQSALFAVQVALVELLRSWGTGPDVVFGHSIGEFAAAYTAGVFDLADAARLVAGRARLMQALPEGGAMAAIEASEAEVAEILSGLPDGARIAVAAVNGPTAVVVSGDEDAVERVMGVAREQERRVSRLRVSHAFHSALMEPILAEYEQIAASIEYRQPTLAADSSVTGRPLSDGDWTTAAYWVRQVRQPVRFHDALSTAIGEQAATRLLEIGPDPVLASLAGSGADTAVAVLRKGLPEAETLLTAVAELFVRGVKVDWAAVFAGTGAVRVDLPTYAFQRQRFWLRSGRSVSDLGGLGLGAAGHPLLGAAVSVAGSDAVLLTSRLSVGSHPWLGDHVVAGSVLVPGTAFVELAVRAGDHVGCGRVEDLTLLAPLVLPRDGAVSVQVGVDEPEADTDGRRALRVYSRPQDAHADGDTDTGRSWTLHATGSLVPQQSVVADWDLSVWPPAGAEALPLDGLYERLTEAGLAYGPAFQGLRGVWARDGELFVEAALPEAAAEDASAYGLHPALLDSVLHALGLQGDKRGQDGQGDQSAEGAMLPFLWSGASLTAVGASAVRVRLSPRGTGEYGLRVADAGGDPVAEIDSLVLRPVSAADLAQAGSASAGASAGSLFRLDWVPAPVPNTTDTSVERGQWAVLAADPQVVDAWSAADVEVTGHPDLGALIAALDEGTPAPRTVVLSVATKSGDLLGGVTDVLCAMRTWLAEERLADSRLVVSTTGAVAISAASGALRTSESLAASAGALRVSEAADVREPDLAGAGVWGLVRSAISEHPGRFALADLDGGPNSYRALAAYEGGSGAESEESQLAVRDGRVWLPRMVRMSSDDGLVPPASAAGSSRTTPWREPGTVLITGGTGGLGAVVARHLVTRHGVRDLVLLSRRGLEAPGAEDVQRELVELGARVTVTACDVSDRTALSAVLDAVPDDAPLTGVVHAAGVLDDGLIADLTPEKLAGVLAAKAESALHLHELTVNDDLDVFLLFSSIAGVVGNAGQSAYAAANSVLDGLASFRREQGLPGVSLAWGMWEQSEGMGGRLSEADVSRLSRQGFPPLSTDQALELLDTALRINEPVALPMALRTSALAGRRDSLPSVLRGLAPATEQRRAAGHTVATGDGQLAERLKGLSPDERDRMLLNVVQTSVATVLGHASPGSIDPTRAFKDLGFDSLTAVDLRNRLNSATALNLTATVVFDHPTVLALRDHIRAELMPEDDGGAGFLFGELEKLQSILAGTVPADEMVRAEVGTRLQKLLAVWADGDGGSETRAGAEEIDDATDDELFSLVDDKPWAI